jgi:aldehyde dehydrogenase (NAD+)
MKQYESYSDHLGKAVNDFHHDRICALFKDHGGQVLFGNENAHVDKKLTPTIILQPKLSSPLMQEETFGPILPLISYSTTQEAVSFISERSKPLAIYYFGKNSESNKSLVQFR